MSSSSNRLELGGNVFELIEFSLVRRLEGAAPAVGRYGVNVAKVREVVRMPKINPLASHIKGVAGLFELRGIPIPAVNLAAALGDRDAPIQPDDQIIVTEFSHKRAGFIVKSTQRIRRIAWAKVLPPASDRSACISGMSLVENNEFLFILDLEKILLEIEGGNGSISKHNPYAEELFQGNRQSLSSVEPSVPPSTGPRVLLVDDSSFILNNTEKALLQYGFRVCKASDGEQAKGILEGQLSQEGGNSKIDLVVSDVEMPKMDGLTLTKWIKEQPQFQSMPVVLHTSLSGQNNQDAGIQVGASGYIVKNDLRSLIRFLEEITGFKPVGFHE